jgi:hypothetical protein
VREDQILPHLAAVAILIASGGQPGGNGTGHFSMCRLPTAMTGHKWKDARRDWHLLSCRGPIAAMGAQSSNLKPEASASLMSRAILSGFSM